ncbi:MAG: NAD-dependent epimerase/dehydratase family protein [Cephaloticoccus sp.]
MRILIVGGTVFVGRALTDVALARGHAVTLLNRGKSAATLLPGGEHLTADRNGDLSVLADREWDAVIDTCAYYPRQVRALRAALAGNPHYTLVSTVSTYAGFATHGQDETAPRAAPLMDDAVNQVDRSTYGPLKVGCEQEAGAESLVVRPGIIVGPHDPTGRFAHWVRRFDAAADFIAPGDGTDALQVIDARDLAAWMIRLVEARITDGFNAVGPGEPLTFREFVEAGVAALGGKAGPRWVAESTLEQMGIEGRSMLPLWVPATSREFAGLFTVSGAKARVAAQKRHSSEKSRTLRDSGAIRRRISS